MGPRGTAIQRATVIVLFLILISVMGCGGSAQSGGGGQQSSPDFKLSLSSTSLSLPGGSSTQFSVSVNSTNGYSSAVTVEVSGLPTGITYTPLVSQVNPGSSITITLVAPIGSPVSQGNVFVAGISGSLSDVATLNLKVTPASASSAPILNQISPSSTTVGVLQGTIWLAGMNFTSSSTVLFDGSRANATVGSSTSIQVQIDISIAAVARSHTVQVSDPANGNSNVLIYDVYSPQAGPLPFAGQPSLPFNQNTAEQGAFADVNGDGRADIVSFYPSDVTNAPQMTIRFGQQDGTFSAPAANNVALAYGIPTRVLTGDLIANGHTDLILIYTNSYQILLNDGQANFTPAGTGTIPGGSWGRGAVGDFNGDHKLDFIIDTGDTAGPTTLAVLFGNGDGTFGTPVQLGSGSEKAARVEAIDLNGDGVTDVVYATYILNGNDTVDMHTLMFHSGGTYTDSAAAGVTGPSLSFVVGDLVVSRKL